MRAATFGESLRRCGVSNAGVREGGNDWPVLHAFVDESGQRGTTAAASDHFVMSAVVFRTKSFPNASRAMQNIRAATGRQPTHEVSFKRLSPAHRSAALEVVGGQAWLKVINVVVCKRHLNDPTMDDAKRYMFAFRMILERLSWLGATHHEVVEYTLAHIVRFKLETLREYEAKLRARDDTSIDWKWLDPNGGKLNQPKVLEPLQLADLAASATGIAFNPPPNGTETVTTYLELMRPRLYRGRTDDGKVTSYGMKMHPWNEATKAAYPWVAAL